MLITLSPMRDDACLTLERAGETLIVNGTAYDLSATPEGGRLDGEEIGCPSLIGDVRRRDGRLALTLILPHDADAPDETLFPAPVEVDHDGPVALPPRGAAASA